MVRAQELEVYCGIHELLAELHALDQKIAIVTKSPDMVPRFFAKQYRWPIDIVLGYHNVRKRKPDPEALLLAMRKIGADPGETFHVGDKPEDTLAARAANVMAIGAGWGSVNLGCLERSKPDRIFMTVKELREYFQECL